MKKNKKTLPNIGCLVKQLYFTSSVSWPFCHFSVWHSGTLSLSVSFSLFTLSFNPLTHVAYSTASSSAGENSGDEQHEKDLDSISAEKAQLKVDLPPIDIVDAPHRYFCCVCVCLCGHRRVLLYRSFQRLYGYCTV